MHSSKKRSRIQTDEPFDVSFPICKNGNVDTGTIDLAKPPSTFLATTKSLPPNPSLSALYSPSTTAKIWGIAQRALNKSSPPTLYPEYTKPGSNEYIYRDLEFWTSGFFPGSLYLLLERERKYPLAMESMGLHILQQRFACNWWTTNLHQNARLRGTHDLGFMISPWARKAWELEGDQRAHQTLITAAQTLATRYNATTRCLRSWDTCITKRYEFSDPKSDFLVIIDNMLNLDLLFWAAAELRSPQLRDIATAHAHTTRLHHIRPDSSTIHVVNFDQHTGAVKAKLTNQGYSDASCWSRGQAWAITGFAQTYLWTRDPIFLTTARNCADYFLAHLPESGIPPWDFTCPRDERTPTDTSAAVIACHGMLLLHEAATARSEPSIYLDGALRILTAVCEQCLSPKASFHTSQVTIPSAELGESTEAGELEVDMGDGLETVLDGATINNYEFAPRRWAMHGLVYADYYFLLCGNKLLDMGIGGEILGNGKF